MDIETIGVIATAIVYWRAVLGAVVAGAFSLVLIQSSAWLSGSQALSFSFAGFMVGLAWDLASSQPRPATKSPTTSKPVAFFASALVGLLWGMASSKGLQTIAAGLPILAVVLFVWYRLSVNRQWLKSEIAKQCVLVTSLAYVIGSTGAWLLS
jgi:hypothetical protein